MITLRAVPWVLTCLGLVAGCGAATAPSGISVSPGSPTPAIASPTPPAASPAATSTITTLGALQQDLAAGTYRLEGASLGIAQLPPIVFTVPDGWRGGGAFEKSQLPGETTGFVALSFWHIDEVYGQACKWQGTLFRPGPTVDDLASALAERPLRGATQPIAVTLDGYAGKYLEWSVPADANFDDCDTDGGHHFFESFTGTGAAGDRYQQGPGQVDQLWILDVNGVRLLIDASTMPPTTNEQRTGLQNVVESIRFER